MKQTAIHQLHLQFKAKLAEFRGWQIPGHFAGLSEEYHAVWNAAGLFDIGHLGRIAVDGPGSPAVLQKTFSRNVERLPEGSAAYGLFCSESGGILSDGVLFHLADAEGAPRFLLTVSAETTDTVVSWLSQHAGKNASITDRTDWTAHFALQGPVSTGLLESFFSPQFKKIKPRTFREFFLKDAPVIIARTGYAGGEGYELLLPAEQGEELFRGILDAGKDYGVMPCGLLCRDLVRIEAGHPLYGNDLEESRSPFEAGLGHVLDLKKSFLGKQALLKLKAAGIRERLVPFVLNQKGVPQKGGSIFSENHEIGVVTSGALSPSLRSGVGLGYVLSRYAQPGQEVDIELKDREIAAKIAAAPLHRTK